MTENLTVPAEAITAAAGAIHRADCEWDLAECTENHVHDRAAREALEAAAPLLHAAGPVDEEFPASWAGGHALVIEFGDEEFIARCQCGIPFGARNPASSLDLWQQPWERHVMRRNQP
jgi:hypothetical protein